MEFSHILAVPHRREGDVGSDLAVLVELLAEGNLAVSIGWWGSWDEVADAAVALLGRRVPGKAVLDVTPPKDGS